MAGSRDWDELVWAWDGWRTESGAKMGDDYETFVTYLNQAATMNGKQRVTTTCSTSKKNKTIYIHIYVCVFLGYQDNGEYWRSGYEDPQFRQVCEDLWQQVLPLYEELHAYVRYFLKETYSDHSSEFPSEGHIPAHLLGTTFVINTC